MKKNDFLKLCKHFSKCNQSERIERLKKQKILNEDICTDLGLSDQNTNTMIADQLIENAIGCFSLPLGVAMNFCIDEKYHLIPMAVEESSIIAAASRTARWVQEHGTLNTNIVGDTIRGQIHLPHIHHLADLQQLLEDKKSSWIKEANEWIVPGLYQRGGGVKNFSLRIIQKSSRPQASLDIFLDPCDAMGANAITQVAEYLKEKLLEVTKEKIGIAIVSNLVDSKLTTARITLNSIDPQLMQSIVDASTFAHYDPYRAATHNKGIMNAIDAVLIATGNDWRAVEAGVHAYAAKDGIYRGITTWKQDNNQLIGELKAPLVVGICGGVTKLHPLAQWSLKLMQVKSANALSRIIAAVGLIQNLAALRALVQEGIMQGHMSLHMKNFMHQLQATPQEKKQLSSRLLRHLKIHKKLSLSDTKNMLNKLRKDLHT